MIVQVDADKHSWAFAREDIPFNVCRERLDRHLVALRSKHGNLNLHVSLGTKGGRELMATVKPYQGNRKGKTADEKRERISELRMYIAEMKKPGIRGVAWLHQEADDGICQMQSLALAMNEKSVVISEDKDLRMVAGMHFDVKEGVYWSTTEFGRMMLTEKGKVWGCGTTWFWLQMLMGDTVDNIPGVPKLSGEFLNKYFPKGKSQSSILCGEKRAMMVMEGVKDDIEAGARVLDAYIYWYGGNEAVERFMEQAFLLWIRRNDDVYDVRNWLNSLGMKMDFSKRQHEILKTLNGEPDNE